MAVINKIRSKAGLLIGIVGFSLAAFILGDFLSNNAGLLQGDASTVGVIGGEKINVQDFEARVQEQINNYRLNTNTDNIDQNTTDQLREQAWNLLVNDMVMKPQYEKIGLKVTPEEVFEMVRGNDPHPQIKQAFTDPNTGQFNPANVINFLKNMDNDQTGRTRAQWLVFEQAIQEERLVQKYNDLIRQSIFVSSAESKQDFINKNRTAYVRYVMMPYAGIADSTIEVSDAELKAVYNASLKKFKQEASRGIEYVMFNIIPSEIDRKAAFDKITQLRSEFQSSTGDSMFVAQNSDEPWAGNYLKKGSLPPMLDTILFNAAPGTIYGPYEEGGFYKLAKLSDVKLLPDSVRARHILLPVADPSQLAASEARADSILAALRSGANFEMLSNQYSSDETAKLKGGDLGWYGPGAMVKEFNDATFAASNGDLFKVNTQFGVHIVQMTGIGTTSRQVRIANVSQRIEPSSKTYQTIYNKANQFALDNNTPEKFDAEVTKQGLTKMSEPALMENARSIGPVQNAREIVRWAFNAKTNEVSKAFESDSYFVVAMLKDVRDRGTASMEQVKDQLLVEARRNKKAEMLIAKMGKASSLDEYASKNQLTVMDAPTVSFASPFLPGAGMEPAVVGKAMTMKANVLSAPMKGQNGVIVLQLTSINEPTPPADLKENTAQLRQQIQGRVQYEVTNALREKADIDDRRARFY